MEMKNLRKDVDNVLDDAFILGANNSPVASAYFLEAIAKMMYVQMFHSEYVVNTERTPYESKREIIDEASESLDI